MYIKSLTIFCSSSNNIDKKYYKIASMLGLYLAKKSVKIVYGGGKDGLMGEISKSAYEAGGEVLGVIPSFLLNKEKKSNLTTKIMVVKDMVERKKILYENGEAYLILPGGSGTIEEAAEIISWKFLGIHNKKIIIFNYDNYWDDFIRVYDNAKNKNFGNKNLQNICKHVNTFEELIKIFP